MNTLHIINQLRKNPQFRKLNNTAKVLFYELLHIHMEKDFPDEFICSNQYLSQIMETHETTIIRNRDKLIKAGFIHFKSHAKTREAGTYSFNTTCISQPTTCKMQDNNILYNYNININNNLEKENNKKKENILEGSIQYEILKENENIKIFEEFLKRYPGAKRSLETEYRHLQKRHADYREVLPLLLPAAEKLIKWTRSRINVGGFAPHYPSLYNWINQRRWETILPKVIHQ